MNFCKNSPGLSRKTVEDLIAEIGVDMKVFPMEKHLASWTGMCPGNNESVGKKSGRTMHGNKQLEAVITEAAWAVTRTKNTFYSTRYHRLVARKGKKRALMAVGHPILRSVWHMLNETCEYKELGAEYLTQRVEQKRRNYLKKELETLGYKVIVSRGDVPSPDAS